MVVENYFLVDREVKLVDLIEISEGDQLLGLYLCDICMKYYD